MPPGLAHLRRAGHASRDPASATSRHHHVTFTHARGQRAHVLEVANQRSLRTLGRVDVELGQVIGHRLSQVAAARRAGERARDYRHPARVRRAEPRAQPSAHQGVGWTVVLLEAPREEIRDLRRCPHVASRAIEDFATERVEASDERTRAPWAEHSLILPRSDSRSGDIHARWRSRASTTLVLWRSSATTKRLRWMRVARLTIGCRTLDRPHSS